MIRANRTNAARTTMVVGVVMASLSFAGGRGGVVERRLSGKRSSSDRASGVRREACRRHLDVHLMRTYHEPLRRVSHEVEGVAGDEGQRRFGRGIEQVAAVRGHDQD